jgi:HPt (histidine-containing phosphotransfer) domain-containing protein
MIPSILERFLPRLVETARARLERARAALARADAAALAEVATEMHALAGEAAMLELAEIARIAREAEAAGRRSETELCLRSLAVLGQAVESLSP